MKKNLLKIFMLVVAFAMNVTGAWADEGDVIYSNDFSSKDQTDFATWTAAGKKPTGYSNAQIGRAGTFSIETGALVFTAAAGKTNSNVSNACVGVFNSSITGATAVKNYDLSFDVTLAVTSHIAHTSFIEFSDESKKVVLTLYATHTRANKTTGATTYGYIVGGDNGFQVVEANNTKAVNAEGTIGNGTQTVLASNVNGTTGSKTYNVTLKAETNGIGQLTIKEGATTIVDGVKVNLSTEKGLKYITFEGLNTYQTNATEITLDNFSIKEGAASTATTANYTVKYKCGETEIKESVSRTGVVGQVVSLTDEDIKNFKDEEKNKKYIYVSNNASSTTIAADGTSIVTVNFREAATYTANAKYNGNVISTTNVFEGDNASLYVPYYQYVGGVLYGSPSVDKGTLSYGQITVSNITADTDVTVSYTEDAQQNAAFYSEAENIATLTPYTDGYTQIRMSNGSVAYAATDGAVIATLPAGKYTLTSSTRAGTTKFYAGSNEIFSLVSTGAVVTTTSDEFTLYETTDITVGAGANNAYFDYILIRKTGDAPTSISCEVTSVGWASFAPMCDVEIPEGVTVYTVQSEPTATFVTLTELEGGTIKAGEGVIIKAEQNTYDFNITTGAEAIEGNLLIGVTEDTALEEGAAYILAKEDDKAVFSKCTAGTLAAGKAYLPASAVPASAGALQIVIDDEATAIEKVATQNSELKTQNLYNLAGQKVSADYKGIVIKNGKRIAVK